MADFYTLMAPFLLALGLLMLSTTVTGQLGLPTDVTSMLRNDTQSLNSISTDYGQIVKDVAAAVLYPNSTNEIATLLQFANNGSTSFGIAARGHAHSVRGQALAHAGVVINMASLNISGPRIVISQSDSLGWYVDVGGEQLWIDVLRATLDKGLSPRSWTDYLYLSVGGTLSNAGISGQTFRFGPQITNVHELDVITGKGDLITCSSTQTPELFYSVLGGLGQFGIITRARVALQTAPKTAKWIRLIYNDFAAFTKDQEHLISSDGRIGNDGFDYVEGFVLLKQGPLDLSFYPPADQPRISALLKQYGILYTIELAKYYDVATRKITIDKVVDFLLKGLNCVPRFIFQQEVPYFDFLNRVQQEEVLLRSLGLWDIAHPWLNLFVPKSRIADFDTGVFKGILLKQQLPDALILIYPMNQNAWNNKMSAIIPEENNFYVVGLLHSSGLNAWQPYDTINAQILQFCKDSGILIKQYLPHYETQKDWIYHYGTKWQSFQQMKVKYDPKKILAPGQRIFN